MNYLQCGGCGRMFRQGTWEEQFLPHHICQENDAQFESRLEVFLGMQFFTGEMEANLLTLKG